MSAARQQPPFATAMPRYRLTPFGRRFFAVLAIAALAVAGTLLCCRGGRGKPQAKADTVVAAKPKVIDIEMRQRIDDVCHTAWRVPQLGACVYDLTADTMVYQFNADTLMPTASCQKLLTGLAALHKLGANYVFTTRLMADSLPNAQGSMGGNVYVRIGFDPLLRPEMLPPLFAQLRKRGARQISGHVVIDCANDECPQPEAHWIPGDLMVRQWGVAYQGRERLARHLKYALRSQGIRAHDSCFVYGSTPVGARTLASVCHPIGDVLMRMWKNSSNVNAEAVLYPLGYRATGRKPYRQNGLEYLRRFVRLKLGRTDSCLVLHDGCGLCCVNAQTPSLICDLLRYGWRDATARRLLLQCLPTAGIDGTLRREMTRTPARGNVCAKTGTLTHPDGITTLAGFARGSNGHYLCFVVMNNHTPVADGRLFQKRFCTALVE